MTKKNALGFNKPQPLNMTSILNFGKYKGQSIGEVLKFDASYLLWAIDKEIIDIEPHLLDDIWDAEQEQNYTGYELGQWDVGIFDEPPH